MEPTSTVASKSEVVYTKSESNIGSNRPSTMDDDEVCLVGILLDTSKSCAGEILGDLIAYHYIDLMLLQTKICFPL